MVDHLSEFELRRGETGIGCNHGGLHRPKGWHFMGFHPQDSESHRNYDGIEYWEYDMWLGLKNGLNHVISIDLMGNMIDHGILGYPIHSNPYILWDSHESM